MTTPRDLIRAALELIRVVDPVEDIDAQEIAGHFKRLNRMISTWGTRDAMIYSDTLLSHVLSAGVASYTIGADADIDTVRPVSIKVAYIRDAASSDTPVEIIDNAKFARIYRKDASASPQYLYYNPTYPVGVINLWGVPNAAETLFMYVNQPLTEFTGLSQVISLPPGYEETIEYNFAMRIAGIYGKSLTVEQIEIAESGLADIRRANRKNKFMEARICVPMGRRRRGLYIGGDDAVDGGGGGGVYGDTYGDTYD